MAVPELASGRPEPAALRRRHQRQADLAIAGFLALFSVAITPLAARGQDNVESLDVLAFVLLLAGPAALVFRRRHPVPVLLVVLGVTLTYSVLDYPDGPVYLSLVVAFITAVMEGHRYAAVALAGVGFVCFPWLPYLVGDEPDPPSWLALGGLAAWLLVLLTVGEIIRVRRERVEELWRSRDEEARRRASEERLRIARDLHDVVAHHISLMNVQAGVALHLMDEQPEQARTALTAIKQASGEALQELRSVLDVLRERDETAPRAPTPGLDRLDVLVERASAAGLDVRADVRGPARPLPAGVEATAYRIVQEALTNVARHAAGARATIRVRYLEQELVVEVEDDGLGASWNGDTPAGSGISNMRQRAEALDGELEAGPCPGRGFRVRARLPISRDPEGDR
jgi:signal transduction histidine kinase